VPEIYTVQSQAGSSFMRMLVRQSPGATDVLPAVRQAVREIDPNIPLRSITTLEADVEQALGPARFYLVLLVVFAGVAVILAAIGLYGVVAYLVSRRTREIGIRMALGADGADVVRLVVRQSMRPALLGIAVGLVGTFAGARVLRSMVYNVGMQDPVTFAAVTAVLLAVVVVAVFIPARQASRIPPVVAFKAEA
jgi:putative ABC transport system permease protein